MTVHTIWIDGTADHQNGVHDIEDSLRAPCAAWLRETNPVLARDMRTRKDRR